jgi:hypothetical protein
VNEAASATRRAWDWLRSAQFSARVPDVSLLSDFQPQGSLWDLRVAYRERVAPAAMFEKIRQGAAAMDLTFSQALCGSLLRAMYMYNRQEAARTLSHSMPAAIGLMVAVTQRWKRGAGGVKFEADTRLLSIPTALLADPAPDLFSVVREALAVRRGRHNDVALALLYASRRIEKLGARLRNASPTLELVREVHFTLSDLTGGALRLRSPIELPVGPSEALRVDSIRTLVSPFAPAHAGLICTLYGGELRFSLLYHEGAVRGDDLLDELLLQLARFTLEKP